MYQASEADLLRLVEYGNRAARAKQVKLYPKPPIADMKSAAQLGIVNALHAFDPARGIPFTSFAKCYIKWELGQYIRVTFFGKREEESKKTYKTRLCHLTQLSDKQAQNGTLVKYVMPIDRQLELEQRIRKLPKYLQEVVEEVLEGWTLDVIAARRKWSYRKSRQITNALARVTGKVGFNIHQEN